MARNFMVLLGAKMREGKSLCVGLDTDVLKIPASFRPDLKTPYGRQLAYNKMVINCTLDLVVAYKPNIAFYPDRDKGRRVLRDTIAYIKLVAPDVPIILDAKRGDIGNSSESYVFEGFSWFGADAMTVNPYMGEDALEPFLKLENKGIIVLCRTSNPGAAEFQNRLVIVHPDDDLRATSGGAGYNFAPLYQLIASNVTNHWNGKSNCCLVVGATAPIELEEVRRIVGNMPILIPGIGEQEGDLQATVEAGQDSTGNGMIINVSRAVIFTGNCGPLDIREAALVYHNRINSYRRVKP